LELSSKGFLKEVSTYNEKYVELTPKGYRYLDKYRSILGFIEEFEL
jgi:predicted transcriptional regulator